MRKCMESLKMQTYLRKYIVWYDSIVKSEAYLILSYLTTVSAHTTLAALKVD